MHELFLPLVVDLVLSVGFVDDNHTYHKYHQACALKSYFFALLMILYFNRGVPDLRRFMADFQSLFEVEKYSLWTTLPLSLTPK